MSSRRLSSFVQKMENLQKNTNERIKFVQEANLSMTRAAQATQAAKIPLGRLTEISSQASDCESLSNGLLCCSG